MAQSYNKDVSGVTGGGAGGLPGGIYRAGQAIVSGWRGYRRRGKKERKKVKEERKEGKEGEIKGGES